MINRFHYLTQDLPGISHQELAEIACRNGIRWIQLRVKEASFEEYLQIAEDVKSICDQFQATLIINDQVEICKITGAHGVHLGKKDMPVAAARKILGDHKIIGGTANTLEDIMDLEKEGADYIGFGPYKFTHTKKNLAPVLGINGYTDMLQSYKPAIPVIAIGGIQLEDMQVVLNTGIYGVAVSSAINLSPKREKAIAAFLEHFL